MTRRDVIVEAHARYHAGQITAEQLHATIEEFRGDGTISAVERDRPAAVGDPAG